MYKKLIVLIAGTGLIATIATSASAARFKCDVTEITGKKVVLDCGDRTHSLHIGDKVKVNKDKKRKAVEGC